MFDLGLPYEQAFDYHIEQAFARGAAENCHRPSVAWHPTTREKEIAVAVRQEDLLAREAVVYEFPTRMIRERTARRVMMARRRMTLGVATVVLAVSTLASLPTV